MSMKILYNLGAKPHTVEQVCKWTIFTEILSLLPFPWVNVSNKKNVNLIFQGFS